MTAWEDVEKHLASLGDNELVQLVEFEQRDYEPWALQLARDELARRCLPQPQIAELRAEAKEAVRLALWDETTPVEDRILDSIVDKVLVATTILIWPFLFHAASRVSEEKRAKKLRFFAGMGALFWIGWAFVGIILWLEAR